MKQIKWVANLSMLFTEVPLLQRFELAQKNGFSNVEIQFPYELKIKDIQEALKKHELNLVMHNLPAGNWQLGDRGIACQKERQEEFIRGLDKALEYAQALGVKKLNCLSGIPSRQSNEKEVQATFIDNLEKAALALEKNNIQLLIEPINTIDVPGFYLSHPQRAFELVEQLKISTLKVQFDIYHAQKSQGNILETIEKNIQKIGHIQFADNPGRHEPGTGELQWEFIFSRLKKIGYDEYISAEYIPTKETSRTLKWMKDYS